MGSTAPLLVFGVGNPARGDDALGPLFIERLAEALSSEVARGSLELLTDYQLQIEHALDLTGRSKVVFVDASTRAAPPFEFLPVVAQAHSAFTTHSLSPGAVLATHEKLGGEAPESWVLAIRGERFELGDPLTARARAHLDAALEFFVSDARGRLHETAGRRLELEGTIQGVGFRPWVYRLATRLGLSGEVYNTTSGVTIEAFGGMHALDSLVSAIQREAPAAARVLALRVTPLPLRKTRGFMIRASIAGGQASLTLPPDLATCDACLADARNPASRYYGYPLTSCMECGPRFAIARTLPYDRETTTMAEFARCAACQRDYESVSDRRFHAETSACSVCGPRVWFADSAGEELDGAQPIVAAAALLQRGLILGIQGLGAFHLACDATNEQAVLRLRERKRRDQQPFALMVQDLAAARQLAEFSEPLEAALVGAAHPIVLAPERPFAVPRAVNGPSRRTGVLLPYTALHHALLAQHGGPLVMTSGNPSGGPAIIDRAEAVEKLGSIVDGFLFHERAITRRVEDSVVAECFAGTRVVRRARGFAPLPIRLPAASPEPVLAVGGHLKNSACLVVDDLAYLTPHLGDLELDESERAWLRDLESFERLLGVRPQVIAHDLHPYYATTRLALARPARRRIGVQHHVAHVQAAVAELRLSEPVLGIVFDGSGFGLDGSSWGAEFLVVDGARATRVQSFRPVPLPGGERAMRDVWRVALAALREACGSARALELAERLPVFEQVPVASLRTLLRMLETSVGIVPARGIGRWYDAVGALVLGLPRASFEAHVAIALEEAAEPLEGVAAYPVNLPSALAETEPLHSAHEVDLRATLVALVEDLLSGVPRAHIAARFQRTLVDATAEVAGRVLEATGVSRVVLSGGCFQNRALERALVEQLGTQTVIMAREVPINDGCLALGQAWAAVLALKLEQTGGQA